MGPRYIASTKLALAFLAGIFLVQVYQAAKRPISTGEAYIYDRFVRPTTRQVLSQELLNRDVLYSMLEKRSVGLFHVSPLSVRLPGLLFGIVYLWSVWRLAQLFLGAGRLFLVAVILAALVPLEWDCFSRANGTGTALALQTFALFLAIEYLTCNLYVRPSNINLSGACLGLSVASRLDFAISAILLSLLFLAAMAVQRKWADWRDRILVPAAVAAFVFLVLPLSHAHAAEEVTPELTAAEAGQLASALQMLRAKAGTDHVRIAAIPPVEPIVNFYRAQYRVITWDRASRNLSSEHFDYYLVSGADEGWVQQRHLIVLYRDGDLLLARSSYDSM
jgi:hypothetical protein